MSEYARSEEVESRRGAGEVDLEGTGAGCKIGVKRKEGEGNWGGRGS